MIGDNNTGTPSSLLTALLVRLIIWLDHASTDNNCTKEDKDLVNYGAFRCLEQERLQVEADLSALFLKRRPLQESVCEVLR